MLGKKKLAVIGVGNIGTALVSGLINEGQLSPSDISGTTAHAATGKRIEKKLGIKLASSNQSAVKEKDIILISVKPQNMEMVLSEIGPSLTKDQIIISVAASVTTTFIEERLSKPIPVIRAMPNTPALLNVGITALCSGANASKAHLDIAEIIFKSVGEVVFVDENLMDGVTALSASGPAYFYVVIESLTEAGVKLGIPRDISTLLAAQTMLGSARMILSSKEHPALLKDSVTTPAGCTVDGLMELEEGKLRVTLIKAVVKAAERARELVLTQNTKKPPSPSSVH